MQRKGMLLVYGNDALSDVLGGKLLIGGSELRILRSLNGFILPLQSGEFGITDFVGGFDLGEVNGMRAPIVARKEHGDDQESPKAKSQPVHHVFESNRLNVFL